MSTQIGTVTELAAELRENYEAAKQAFGPRLDERLAPFKRVILAEMVRGRTNSLAALADVLVRKEEVLGLIPDLERLMLSAAACRIVLEGRGKRMEDA